MTNTEKLRILGEALHGPRWMRAAARDLGVNYRTMLRWHAGQSPINDKIVVELLAISRTRAATINAAMEQCRGHTQN
jgi:hypothetical protein